MCVLRPTPAILVDRFTAISVRRSYGGEQALSPSSRGRNRSDEPDQGLRKEPGSLYESALMMCDPAFTSLTRQWKSKAKRLLRECSTLAPRFPKAHALLAYIHYQYGDVTAAELSLRRALRFDCDNRVYLRFFLAILVAEGKNTLASRWIRRLADLEGLDLSNLVTELRNANFPTDTTTLVLNAFPNGVGWFESHLWDEIEQIQIRGRNRSELDSELEQQIDLCRPKKIDARRVPRNLRSLIPVALKWGIGDDFARGLLVSRTSKSEKRQLCKVLSVEVRRRINDWLDHFGAEVAMTEEAACFMYLLLAYEEL